MTVTVAVLLAGFGSVSVAVTFAVFAMLPAVSVSTGMEMLAVAPDGMVPRSQVTVWPLTVQLPTVVVTGLAQDAWLESRILRLAGNSSVHTTLWAVAAPLLVTVLEKVCAPKAGPSFKLLADKLTLISALSVLTGMLIVPPQLAAVVTVVEPRYVSPWPNPEASADALEKSSMVNVVLGSPLKAPSALKAFPETLTAFENSEVLPLGSVAVALRMVLPVPAVRTGAFCRLLAPKTSAWQALLAFGPAVSRSMPSAPLP